MDDLKNKIIVEKLECAASLESIGFTSTVRMTNPTNAIFIFPKSEALEKAKADYFEGKLLVPPTLFQDRKYALLRAITLLKTRWAGR